MLHKINLPACTQHLDWVVQFQGGLLRTLCVENLKAEEVTVEWVESQRPDIGNAWIIRFCAWSKNGKSVLNRMQTMAALPKSDKLALLTHYDANVCYPEAFDETLPPPPATKPLPNGLSADAIFAYRDFFELFYAPIFYRDKGYPIDAEDLNGQPFSKDQYLEAYRTANHKIQVCPLCDGSMDDPEIDHWLAKKYFPELNCHPQNLLETCGACNSPTNKGEKLALDGDASQPFENWLHPHLRPSIKNFEITIERGKPRLASDDPLTQVRLSRFEVLINLNKRWKREYGIQFKGVQQKLRGAKRRDGLFDQNLLIKKLQLWKTEAEDERGIRPHKLLEGCLLSSALVDGSNTFIELYIYATADP